MVTDDQVSRITLLSKEELRQRRCCLPFEELVSLHQRLETPSLLWIRSRNQQVTEQVHSFCFIEHTGSRKLLASHERRDICSRSNTCAQCNNLQLERVCPKLHVLLVPSFRFTASLCLIRSYSLVKTQACKTHKTFETEKHQSEQAWLGLCDHALGKCWQS